MWEVGVHEVDELALGQVLPRTLHSSPVDIIPSVLLNGISFLSHRIYTAEKTSLYTTILPSLSGIRYSSKPFLLYLLALNTGNKRLSGHTSLKLHMYIYIYIYIYMCVCVCVCVCISYYLISSLVLR